MISLLSVVNVFAADNATKILDQAASKFKAAGGVLIGYSYDMNGETGKGTIKMQGKKFVNTFADHVIWFNGKTLWTLVKENEEVNVTTPTPKEWQVSILILFLICISRAIRQVWENQLLLIMKWF